MFLADTNVSYLYLGKGFWYIVRERNRVHFFLFFSKKTIIGFEENFWRWDKLWEVKRVKFETFVLLYSIGYITCFAVANYIMIVIA